MITNSMEPFKITWIFKKMIKIKENEKLSCKMDIIRQTRMKSQKFLVLIRRNAVLWHILMLKKRL